jgi:hypothetical protein
MQRINARQFGVTVTWNCILTIINLMLTNLYIYIFIWRYFCFSSLIFNTDFLNICIQDIPGGKINIVGGHSIDYSKKKIYTNMCPIPNGFRYLASSIFKSARNIFLPSLSVSNCNSQMTLHTDSHASDFGALRCGQIHVLAALLQREPRPRYSLDRRTSLTNNENNNSTCLLRINLLFAAAIIVFVSTKARKAGSYKWRTSNSKNVK